MFMCVCVWERERERERESVFVFTEQRQCVLCVTTTMFYHTSRDLEDLLHLLTQWVENDDVAADEVHRDEALDDGQSRAWRHRLQDVVLHVLTVDEIASGCHGQVEHHHH